MTSPLAAAISPRTPRRRDWTAPTGHGRVEPVNLVYPDEGLTVSGPRPLQAAEVHTSRPRAVTLHLMTMNGGAVPAAHAAQR